MQCASGASPVLVQMAVKLKVFSEVMNRLSVVFREDVAQLQKQRFMALSYPTVGFFGRCHLFEVAVF